MIHILLQKVQTFSFKSVKPCALLLRRCCSGRRVFVRCCDVRGLRIKNRACGSECLHVMYKTIAARSQPAEIRPKSNSRKPKP